MSTVNSVSANQYAKSVYAYDTSAAKAAQDQKDALSPDASSKNLQNKDRVELSHNTDISSMSASDRAALVENLKADMENQMSRFTSMMMQMFQKQGLTAATAQGDGLWKFIASGNYTVDAATKADAQQAISEEGFWGVKQTSQRIFDFAQALAGDDMDKMREMQEAVEKGFKAASVAWGGEMPSITGETHEAVNKLFDKYYEESED